MSSQYTRTHIRNIKHISSSNEGYRIARVVKRQKMLLNGSDF